MNKTNELDAQLIHQFVELAHDNINVPQMTEMLNRYPGLLNAPRPGSDKETALGAATHMRARKVIDFLMRRGADLDIFAACALDRVDRVGALLDKHAKLISARAKHAHNLDLMDLSPSDAMTALLLRRGYKLSIHAAAAKGMLEEVQRMLGEDPARIRALDGEGLQPLHSACIGGHENIVALLIERGADVTHLGANCRPLTYACIWGRDKIVPLLLKLDRDINAITTGYQLSYLHCVVRWAKGTPAANEAIIRMLFKAGIDSSIRNKDGMTAYDMAVERGAEGKAMAELIKELGGTP